MPVYQSSEQLYGVLRSLFERIGQDDPGASDSVSASKMILRMRLIDPSAEITINARSNPVKIYYGDSSLRPEFEVQIRSDALHQILLGELPIRKALGNGQLKVKGPVAKSIALADIFHRGQAVYPEILKQQGLIE